MHQNMVKVNKKPTQQVFNFRFKFRKNQESFVASGPTDLQPHAHHKAFGDRQIHFRVSRTDPTVHIVFTSIKRKNCERQRKTDKTSGCN